MARWKSVSADWARARSTPGQRRPRRRAGSRRRRRRTGRSAAAGTRTSASAAARLRSATFSGPSFLTNPLTRKSTALSEPRCGVPNVISVRVSCQPPRHSRYQRATSPPIECPIRMSLASGLRWRWACSFSSTRRCSRRAATRLSRRQSYGNSMYVSPGTTSNVSVIIRRDAAVDVDAPEARDRGARRDIRRGAVDAVAEVVALPRVGGQLERRDAAPERPQRPADRHRRRRPHVLAVARAARCRGSPAAAPRRHPTVAWPSILPRVRRARSLYQPAPIVDHLMWGWPPTSTRTSG